MLIAQMTPAIPTSLTVTIWSLRSVPISMLILMFLFNSGSVAVPNPNLHFWFDAIAIAGIIAIITYWSRLQQSRWHPSILIYLYTSIILIFRNPYGILNTIANNQLVTNWHSMASSLWVGVGILAIGAVIELLIFHLRQLKAWTWWISFAISMLYVCSIIFFCSGTLGIWSLLDPDTKQAFKRRLVADRQLTKAGD
jgi:hypothetical protein